jgi:hypothetical protein
MRLHNKTILDKPLSSTLTQLYSTNAKHSQDLFVVINQNYRNSASTRYSVSISIMLRCRLFENQLVQLSREKTFGTTKAVNFISPSDYKQRKVI